MSSSSSLTLHKEGLPLGRTETGSHGCEPPTPTPPEVRLWPVAGPPVTWADAMGVKSPAYPHRPDSCYCSAPCRAR